MGEKPKECIHLSIQCPQGTLKLNLENKHKIYEPVSESNSKAQAASKQSASKVTLKHHSQGKKLPQKHRCKDACLTLCRFPNYVKCAELVAILLLLVLLSQVAHLLVGLIPSMPILVLDGATQASLPVLDTLLRAIQGTEVWKGRNWRLRRPNIILPRLSLMETKPSQSLFDYAGGTFEDEYGKKRKFCFPFINAAFALNSDLPATVAKSMIAMSPLAIPIVFERKKVDNRLTVQMDGNSLDAYDADGIKKLSKHAAICHQEIAIFLKWFCGKEKRIQCWKDHVDCFRPVTHHGRFTQPKSDSTTDFLCAALSLFRQLLHFASEKAEWITPEEASGFLLQYWRLVLPESAPSESGQVTQAELAYDTPEVFHQFFTKEYLPTYQNQIMQGAKGESGTMGLVRELDGTSWFIAPRKCFLDVYAKWLEERGSTAFDLSASKGEANMQRQLMEAGIPLRREKNNPATWRYAFYGKDRGMVNCFALPIRQLPEAVQTAFGEFFGIDLAEMTVPKQPEPLPNCEKRADAL